MSAPAPQKQSTYKDLLVEQDKNGALPPITTFECQYAHLAEQILKRGALKPSRQLLSPESQKRVMTHSITAGQIRVPMGVLKHRGDARHVMPYPGWAIEGFPNLGRKRLSLRQVAEELRWFLSGSTNTKELHNCHIWDGDAAKAKDRGFDYPEGELGPIYGFQWRRLTNDHGESVDQIENMVSCLVKDPFDRGIMVNAFNVLDVPKMVLRPCHYAFQLICSLGRSSHIVNVDCIVSMRSTDVGLGLPFNVASYSLLTALICLEATKRTAANPSLEKLHNHTGGSPLLWPWEYELGDVIVNMADCHVYEPHAQMMQEYATHVSATLNSSQDGFLAIGDRVVGSTVYLGDLASPDAFAEMTPAQKKLLDIGESFEKPEWNAPRVPLTLFT